MKIPSEFELSAREIVIDPLLCVCERDGMILNFGMFPERSVMIHESKSGMFEREMKLNEIVRRSHLRYIQKRLKKRENHKNRRRMDKVKGKEMNVYEKCIFDFPFLKVLNCQKKGNQR